MEGRKFELLEKKMCKELGILEDKYASGAEMSETDLKRIDLLVHSLKSLATYRAMYEAEHAPVMAEEELSGARGRSSVTGRYVSRDSGNSFSDGYSRGYSEAMSQMQNGNSGRYPSHPWQYPNQGSW